MRLRRRTPKAVTPLALLDEAYEHRIDAMERLRRAHASVLAAEAGLERDRRSARAAVDRLEAGARRALNEGDEQQAKELASRCVPLDADIDHLTASLDRVRDTEAALGAALRLIEQQLDAVRRRRDSLRHTHAKAALAAVQDDLRALAEQYAPVTEALDRTAGTGSDADATGAL
jgi:phage shock protein A